MPGAEVQDTGRAKRRVGLRITLAALLVSLAGLVAVTLRFTLAGERELLHLDELALLQRELVIAVACVIVSALVALVLTLVTLDARSRFEDALWRSVARHRALVEDQSELVSLARDDGTLVYVNPAYARHFDSTPAALAGRNLYDFVAPSEREAVRLQVAGVMRTGRERSGENRMLAPDGSERWVAWTNKRRQEPEGTLLHSVGRDITERKRVERALRASQAFLHRTSEVAGIGGWELDLHTDEMTWSEQVRRILDVDDDFTGDREAVLQSYAPEGRERLRQAVNDCIERGLPWDLELPRVTTTQRRIWVRTVGSLELEHGKPRRIVGALQDISERKQLERRLADSERFLRQITDSLAVRIAYLDAHRRYRFVNLAHCRRYGRTREEILGRTRAELSGGSGDAAVEPRIGEVLRGHPQRFDYEETLQGVTHRIQSQLIPDVGEDGRVVGFYATGVDVTDRVASERQLRELTEIAELSPDFILQATRDGTIEYMNPALRAAAGLAADAPLAGMRMADLGTAEASERYASEVQPALRRTGSWLGETALRLAAGRVVPVSHLMIAHRDGAGQVQRLSAVMRDISGEVAARDALLLRTSTLQSATEALQDETGRLLLLARRDALTGLLNRPGLEEWLAARDAEVRAGTLALLYVDLDRFKPVNDTYGHAAGDRVLVEVGRRLQAVVRPGDAVARLGGDEFALALAGVRERAHAERVAAKVVAAVAEPIAVDGLAIEVGASVGIAWRVAPAGGAQGLLTHADGMLYKAKASGRGRFE